MELTSRPRPAQATYKAQLWLGFAVAFLVLWPCAGPVPLGLLFFWLSLCARWEPGLLSAL